MNIAFPAALIFILVLPGVILRYAYSRGFWYWASPTSISSVSGDFFYGVIGAVPMHCLFVFVAQMFDYRVDFKTVAALLISNFGQQGELLTIALSEIESFPFQIAAYFIVACAASAFLGYFGHWLVRKFKLDLRTQFLRFNNQWYYLLTGEVLSFREVDDAQRVIDGVYLSAVVEQGKETYLYRGIVDDFTFDSTGQLDTIRLVMADRRNLSDDETSSAESDFGTDDQLKAKPKADIVETSKAPAARFYLIKGDYLILRYAQTKTINLDYFALENE